MSLFDPMRDFLHSRAAKTMNEGAARVHLVTEHTVCAPGTFVFPGTDTHAGIEVGGHRVGFVSYGVNPLGDRLYINKIEIDPAHQKKGMGLAVLWHFWLTHQVPIVPISQYGTSGGFWNLARRRFAAAGALIEPELRQCELDDAKQRWQHLVPEPDHLRQIRELKACPEWTAIEAHIKASEQP